MSRSGDIFIDNDNDDNNNDRNNYFTPCACARGKYGACTHLVHILVVTPVMQVWSSSQFVAAVQYVHMLIGNCAEGFAQ